jgi:hypothetical protein
MASQVFRDGVLDGQVAIAAGQFATRRTPAAEQP